VYENIVQDFHRNILSAASGVMFFIPLSILVLVVFKPSLSRSNRTKAVPAKLRQHTWEEPVHGQCTSWPLSQTGGSEAKFIAQETSENFSSVRVAPFLEDDATGNITSSETPQRLEITVSLIHREDEC
jgi:hypothetical protein